MNAAEPLVTHIRTRGVLTPLDRPLHTAGGGTDVASLVLVDISSSAGVIGHAYAFAYRADMLATLTRLVRDLSATLLGGPIAPQAATARLRTGLTLLGTAGLAQMALAVLDTALWDLLARSAGLPLVRLLGGHPQPVRAYASFGMEGADCAARSAAAAAESGFGSVKIKIGYPTLVEDLEVLDAVRNEVGDGVDIMVDYNQALTVPEALRRCHALDTRDLAWIEEPVAADDLDGHARIAEQIRTPIQIGENAWGPAGIRAILNRRAGDLVMIDLVKVGGISEWLTAAALCTSANIPYSDHFYQEASVHLMALSPGAHLLEFYGPADAILTQPLTTAHGHIVAGEGPGSGVDWDEEAVARYVRCGHEVGSRLGR
ncbi:enolase C-terminal domain-like protein [Nocardia brevicatena]|uniref:enolase C-terminal domain-like protein n=1 Tax=Nocardia brevicatena TaxID=37327 RepID=UPI0002FC3B77|nr:enolase C-terminal domain-like protein [Nocardia brevicatena]